MRTKSLIPAAAVVFAASLALAAPASAAVTFDSATGTGFVGKGDVQTAFGWNNPALQSKAKDLSFTYSTTDTYEAVCSWTTGEGTRGEKTHNVDHKKKTALSSTVAYDARVKNQITGFILSGSGATTTTGGEVPLIDGPCMGNPGHDGTWTSVDLTGSTGGLYLVHAGTAVLLQ